MLDLLDLGKGDGKMREGMARGGVGRGGDGRGGSGKARGGSGKGGSGKARGGSGKGRGKGTSSNRCGSRQQRSGFMHHGSPL